MNRIKVIFVFDVALLLLAWAGFGQVSGADAPEKHDQDVQAYKIKIATACYETMTNILQDLKGLSKQYPPLSDIGSTPIVKGKLANSGTVRLRYLKNVRHVSPSIVTGISSPPSQGFPIPQSGQSPESLRTVVVDDGGAILMVMIRNSDDQSFIGEYGHYYPLLTKRNLNKLFLVYRLELNTTNQAMEKAVSDIIQNEA